MFFLFVLTCTCMVFFQLITVLCICMYGLCSCVCAAYDLMKGMLLFVVIAPCTLKTYHLIAPMFNCILCYWKVCIYLRHGLFGRQNMFPFFFYECILCNALFFSKSFCSNINWQHMTSNLQLLFRWFTRETFQPVSPY